MNINVNVTFNGLDELTGLLTNLTQQLQNANTTPTTDTKILPPTKTPQESEIETVTVDDFRELLTQVIDCEQNDKAKKIMAVYGAERVSDLTDADRSECAIALRQLLKDESR